MRGFGRLLFCPHPGAHLCRLRATCIGPSPAPADFRLTCPKQFVGVSPLPAARSPPISRPPPPPPPFPTAAVSTLECSARNATSRDFIYDGQVIYLDRHRVECSTASVLTRFQLKNNGNSRIHYEYDCLPIRNPGPLVEKMSNEGSSNQNYAVSALFNMSVKCSTGTVLQQFQLTRPAQTTSVAYKYGCMPIRTLGACRTLTTTPEMLPSDSGTPTGLKNPGLIMDLLPVTLPSNPVTLLLEKLPVACGSGEVLQRFELTEVVVGSAKAMAYDFRCCSVYK